MSAYKYNSSGIWNSIFRQHKARYVGLFSLIVFTAALFGTLLQSWEATYKYRKTSGDVFQAASFNTMLDVMRGFNVAAMLITGMCLLILVFFLVRFVVTPRLYELRIFRQVGASNMLLYYLLYREIFLITILGVALGDILVLFVSPVYEYIQFRTGLAPAGLDISYSVKAIISSSLIVSCVVFLGAWRVVKNAVMERKEKERRGRTRIFAHLVSVCVLGALTFLILAPEDTVPTNASMVLLIPLSVLLLSLELPLFVTFFIYLVSSILPLKRFPRLLIAVQNMKQAGNRNIPALPMILFLSFLIPLTLVMSTGQNVSKVENFSSIEADYVARFEKENSHSKTDGLKIESDNVFIVDIFDGIVDFEHMYVNGDVSAAAYPVVKLESFVPTCHVIEGDLNDVNGLHIATTNTEKHVGEKQKLLTKEGKIIDTDVAAVLSECGMFYYDVIFDSRTVDMGNLHSFSFALIKGDDVMPNFMEGGWSVYEKSEWEREVLSDTVQSQHQALLMMFIVPALLALFAVMISVSVARKNAMKSYSALWEIGFETKDIVVTEIFHGVIQMLFAILTSFFPILFVFIKVKNLSSSVGASLVFDVPITVGAYVFMIVTLLVAFIVSGIHIARGIEVNHAS